jgi:hypothetical protein
MEERHTLEMRRAAHLSPKFRLLLKVKFLLHVTSVSIQRRQERCRMNEKTHQATRFLSHLQMMPKVDLPLASRSNPQFRSLEEG